MNIEKFYYKFQEIRKISTDTRKLIPGSIFFALKGHNFNGNKFANEALEMGCSLAVADEDISPRDKRIIRVPDVLSFLQELAHYHRSQFEIPLIAITGTNGKTTTKELIASILEKNFSLVATKGNLNNHIGVPLTLLDIDEKTQIAVIEMGANHVGEISFLCDIANPTHGLITNIGEAHLEGFGSPEKVREAKNELYQHIRKKNGTVFINEDDPILTELARGIEKFSYGKDRKSDIQGKEEVEEIFSTLQWRSSKENDDWRMIKTHLVGGYNFYNILASICVGKYFGLSDHYAAQALESYEPGMNRSQYINTGRNNVILDAYNANPDSLKAAILNFRAHQAERKVAILGDMFELGDYSLQAHKEILRLLSDPVFCRVLLVGKEFESAGKDLDISVFPNIETLSSFLKEQPLNESLILLKGSRGMAMEKLLGDL